MKSKGEVVGLVSERACRLSDKHLSAETVFQNLLQVNIMAVWNEGLSLIVFTTFVCKLVRWLKEAGPAFGERVAMLEGVVSHFLQREFHFFHATDSLALVML